MPSIFLPTYREGYESCLPVDRSLYIRLAPMMTGRALKDSWTAFEALMVRARGGMRLLESDAPNPSFPMLILRPAAVQAMKPILERCGEILPIHCADAAVSLFNVTTTIDALDEAASKVVRFPSGRIMVVERYVLRSDRLQGATVFKLPHGQGSPILVADEFVQTWERAQLRGLYFRKVWSSE